VAIADDDATKFAESIKKINVKTIPNLRFEHDMNLLNLAIDQESVSIVQFIQSLFKNHDEERKSLVSHRYLRGLQAIHQVMSLGHLTLITIVLDMGGDLSSNMHNNLTPMHCAAQTYHGLLSLALMTKQYRICATQRDDMQATPLHFAATYHITKNIEWLISQGADLDAQDIQGHTTLHICIMRVLKEPEYFDDYKRIIKSLLFAGAKRTLRTRKKQTALDIL
jgi:ankyrin repeat protein